MKKQIAYLNWGLLVFGLALTACLHKPGPSPSEPEKVQWQSRMQALSQSLSELLPILASPKEFNDPRNRPLIMRDAKTLATMAHAVNSTGGTQGGDPSIQFVSGRFASDMNEAVHQMDIENYRFARYLLRGATSYCIACHTRTDQGRQNLRLGLGSNVDRLPPIDRAEYHIAIRDFDQALKDFLQILNSPNAQIESPQAMELAAEKALAVAVRVKRDPELSAQIIQKISGSDWAPVYLRLNAMAWKTAVDEWLKESGSIPANRLLPRAKALMVKGWKFSASSPQSRAGLIYYLRASTLLHDLLKSGEKAPGYGEGLYYAGMAAESLRDLNLWTLHESYFESCIRFQPRTPMAKRCYLRLEALQLGAYADSDTSYVPAHVRDHLRELRGLAEKEGGQFLDWGYIE